MALMTISELTVVEIVAASNEDKVFFSFSLI